MYGRIYYYYSPALLMLLALGKRVVAETHNKLPDIIKYNII